MTTYYPFLGFLVVASLMYSTKELRARAEMHGRDQGLYGTVAGVVYLFIFAIAFVAIQMLYELGADELYFGAARPKPASIAMKSLAGLICGGLSVYGLAEVLKRKWNKDQLRK